MTRIFKAESAENFMPGYSVHDPNKPELSQQELEKRLARLKKLLSALRSIKK